MPSPSDQLDLPGGVVGWVLGGLQGVSGLAGEVSALGLLLKQAEVAGAVGLSPLSDNQVGKTSVLCPCPGLAVSPGPHHGDLCDHPFCKPAGSAGLSLGPAQCSLLQSFPAQQPRSRELWICSPVVTVTRLACALLGRKPWQGGVGGNHQLGGGCQSCSRFTLMCK